MKTTSSHKTKRLKTTAANANKNIDRAFNRIAKGKFHGIGHERNKAWRIAELEREIVECDDAPFRA